MSSSLLLQQYPVCLVRLIWMVFRDWRYVAIQLLFCGMLRPGFMQHPNLSHSLSLSLSLYIYIYIYKYEKLN